MFRASEFKRIASKATIVELPVLQPLRKVRWRQLNHHSRMNILVSYDAVVVGNGRPVDAVSLSGYDGEVEDPHVNEIDERAYESHDPSGYDIDYISSG